MQRLEVSGAVRLIYRLLGVKRLNTYLRILKCNAESKSSSYRCLRVFVIVCGFENYLKNMFYTEEGGVTQENVVAFDSTVTDGGDGLANCVCMCFQADP